MSAQQAKHGLIVAVFLALSAIRTAAGQQAQPSAVANGASFAGNEVAPGSIVTIFGTNLSAGTAQATVTPWPTTLGGISVRINGANVPLYFVSPNQINFQLPDEALTGYGGALVGLPTIDTDIFVVLPGTNSSDWVGLPFTVSTAAPGIFVDFSGRAIAQNQDYTLNAAANPASLGSYITAYLTGIGPVDNPITDGAAAPDSPLSRATLPFSATVGGVSSNVLFLGLAPGYVGLAQADIQIPNLVAGTYSLVITVGGAVSNGGLITVSEGTLVPQYLFTSVIGGGVSGIPATASSSYDGGAVVPYNYAPTSGFSTAVVEVDGTLSPSSGSITMNSDHWLWAFGEPSTGTSFAGYITTPNDPTIIPYPQFYSNRPTSETVTVADPYCAPTSNVVAYPNNYLGRFPMPSVTGAPLPASTFRGVTQLDAWRGILTNPAGNPGCSGSLHDAFVETVRRVKLMGADHITVTNYGWVVDATAAVPVVDYGQVNSANQQISESELAFIVSTATAAGLDVWLNIDISSNDELNNVPLPLAPSPQWEAAFLDSYTQYIVVQAQRAQACGVKAMMLNWVDYYIDLANYLDIYGSQMALALSQVRSAFQGLVTLYDIQTDNADLSPVASLYNGVDAIMVEYAGDLVTPAQSQQLTVALLKQVYKQSLAKTAEKLSPFQNRPLAVVGYVYSYENSLAIGLVGGGAESCAQCNTLQTDFSVQAIAYEALFEAMAESGLTFKSFDTFGYWPTDVILPDLSVSPEMDLGDPNIGRSVRNKPAEVIIQHWFAK